MNVEQLDRLKRYGDVTTQWQRSTWRTLGKLGNYSKLASRLPAHRGAAWALLTDLDDVAAEIEAYQDIDPTLHTLHGTFLYVATKLKALTSSFRKALQTDDPEDAQRFGAALVLCVIGLKLLNTQTPTELHKAAQIATASQPAQMV